MKVTKDLAREIHKEWSEQSWLKVPDYDALRDFCDTKSGGDLDNFQLNMLTDWVEDLDSILKISSPEVYRGE